MIDHVVGVDFIQPYEFNKNCHKLNSKVIRNYIESESYERV